jgi:hypothetical protein
VQSQWIIFNESEIKDLCSVHEVQFNIKQFKGLLFCGFEVCRHSRPSYLNRLWPRAVKVFLYDINIKPWKDFRYFLFIQTRTQYNPLETSGAENLICFRIPYNFRVHNVNVYVLPQTVWSRFTRLKKMFPKCFHFVVLVVVSLQLKGKCFVVFRIVNPDKSDRD